MNRKYFCFPLVLALFLLFAGRGSLLFAAEPLPEGFGTLILGMEMDGVKRALEQDPRFQFRGDPDVSLLSRPNESMIDAEGSYYISRGYFQFHQRRLYTIILVLDEERIDYFTLYSRLTEKYGEPDSLDPQECLWENDTIRMVLERPLAVKYIDLAIFREKRGEGEIRPSYDSVLREEFLQEF